jgi:hypothetical protein
MVLAMFNGNRASAIMTQLQYFMLIKKLQTMDSNVHICVYVYIHTYMYGKVNNSTEKTYMPQNLLCHRNKSSYK